MIITRLCILIILTSFPVFSQVGINTTTPDTSSALDIKSTSSGILIPRMTENQKMNISNPTKGLLIFQIDGNEGFWYFDSSYWIPIDSNGEFTSYNGVVYNTTSPQSDDFVIGSNSLDDVSGENDDSRLFFDKGKSAFRAGYTNGTNWDNSNLGDYSIGLGNNVVAPSTSEIALGSYNTDYLTAASNTDRIFSVGNGYEDGEDIVRNNALTILKNGNIGIGTETPTEVLELHGNSNNNWDADLDIYSYSTNLTSFHIRSASGTLEEPGPVYNKNFDNILNIEAQGYDGSNYRTASSIYLGTMDNQNTGPGDMPGRIDFYTTPDGSSNVLIRARIDDQGNFGIGTGTNGLTEKLEVNGKIKATSINFSNLPTESQLGSLSTGDLYQTTDGDLKIKL
ncbi:cell wall surface anchor family protein [unidentified eubacterium SCB49]|nr:cell wall surface anchor family protein [unidentified eubacterium SCB49]